MLRSTAGSATINYAEDDGEPFFLAEDCAVKAATPVNVKISLSPFFHFSHTLLHKRRVAFPDICQWRVGVVTATKNTIEQDATSPSSSSSTTCFFLSFPASSHYGFKGSLFELLGRVESDIMSNLHRLVGAVAGSGEVPTMKRQASASAALHLINLLRSGGNQQQEVGDGTVTTTTTNTPTTLVIAIDDPSGLTYVETKPGEDDECVCVVVNPANSQNDPGSCGDQDQDNSMNEAAAVHRWNVHVVKGGAGGVNSETENSSSNTLPRTSSATAEDVAALVSKSTKIVCLSGAGISVESGVPPFRDASAFTTSKNKEKATAGATTKKKHISDGNAIWSSFDANKMTLRNFNRVQFAYDFARKKGEATQDDGNDVTQQEEGAAAVTDLRRDESVYDLADDIPAQWWCLKRDLMTKVSTAQPNPAHMFFAKLGNNEDKNKKLSKIFTQNIDGLHHKSFASSLSAARGTTMMNSNTSRNSLADDLVVEFHGHLRSLICSRNAGSKYNPVPWGGNSSENGCCNYILNDPQDVDPFYDISQNVEFPLPVPRCPKCAAAISKKMPNDQESADGAVHPLPPPLRSETVFFGQPLPEGAIDQAEETIKTNCDLLFIIGTSLIVPPVCDLPSVAVANKIPFVIINMHETTYDRYAAAVVREPAGAFLQRVGELIDLW